MQAPVPPNSSWSALRELFQSPRTEDVLDFYRRLKDRDALVTWLKGWPRGRADLREADGDRRVVVVIPTLDAQAPLAQRCREQLFRGLQIVFVESGRDPDFKFGHNVNAGIRRAMEYAPDWVVVSNDDVTCLDPPSVLRGGLATLDPERTDAVFCRPRTPSQSWPVALGEPNELEFLTHRVAGVGRTIIDLRRRFGVRLDLVPLLWPSARATPGRPYPLRSRLMRLRWNYRLKYRFLLNGSLAILSGRWLEREARLAAGAPSPFDEVFLNGWEDVELSLRLTKRAERCASIPYRIGHVGGASLGSGEPRLLRNVVNWAYLNLLLESAPLRYFGPAPYAD